MYISKAMKNSKQQTTLIFASIMLALFALTALVNLGSFAGSYTIAYESTEFIEAQSAQDSEQGCLAYLESHSKAAAFLQTRRANRQVHFRPQQTHSTQGYFGRDASLLNRVNHLAVKGFPAFKDIPGYPSPAVFCTAKDYYVYTLKRILC